MKKFMVLLCLFAITLFCFVPATSAFAKTEPKYTVKFNGLKFTVNNKTVDIAKKLSVANAITNCTFITDDVLAIEAHINPHRSYFILYDVLSEKFIYEAIGCMFTWKKGDIESILYAEDNSATAEQDRILNKQGEVLYKAKKGTFIYDYKRKKNTLTITLTNKTGEISKTVKVKIKK